MSELSDRLTAWRQRRQQKAMSESPMIRRLVGWLFSGVLFGLIPIAIATLVTAPRLTHINTTRVGVGAADSLHTTATVVTQHASLNDVLATGSLLILAASLSGGPCIGLIGTGGSWRWAKMIVGGSAVIILALCIGFYANILSSINPDQSSIATRSIVLFFCSLGIGLGGVLLGDS